MTHIFGISDEQLTDINPFDESVVDEIFGGTTPSERAGVPSEGQQGLIEDALDSIPRQFDDTPGGGFGDVIQEDAENVAGDSRVQLVVFAALALGVLYLVRPLLEITATLVDEVAADG